MSAVGGAQRTDEALRAFPASAALAAELARRGDRKILHFGSLAGWPHTVARVSRDMGIPSENAVHVYKDVLDLDRKLPYDLSVFQHADPLPRKIAKTWRFLRALPSRYAVAHYHSTTLLHREYHFAFEGPWLRRQGVPMVLSLGGGDARIDAEAARVNPYYYNTPERLHDLRIRLRWFSWSRNIAVCATDPEMAQIARSYFEHVEIFPQPVEMQRFPFRPPAPETREPLVLHVPTNPRIKGTQHVVDASERLKKKGLRFEFRMVRQLSQSDFYELLSRCDVYVDELRCGAHGMTAVEAMAMGKPTVTYIRDNLVGDYPADMPLVNANPDTIESVLERLILDVGLRHEIGTASRRYAERRHDARVVVDGLAATYLRLLEKA